MAQQQSYQPLKKHKILSGCDSCGRELCCLTFLPKPTNVNLETLGKQGNKNKLLGICGKPKCCLNFES